MPITDVRSGNGNERSWTYHFKGGDHKVLWNEAESPKPWLLSLLGNNAYSLGVGDITHQLKNVPGWAGNLEDAIEFLGVKLGLNVMGGITNEPSKSPQPKPHVVFDRMKRNTALRYGAYALFLGHREAIREAQQNRYGLALFNNALYDWKFTSPAGQIASLAVLYDLLPNEFREIASRNVHESIKIRAHLDCHPASQRLYLTSSDRLFSEDVILPISNAPMDLTQKVISHPIFQGAITIFKGFTMQRLDATFSP